MQISNKSIVSKTREIYYGTVQPTNQPRPAWMSDARLLPKTPVPYSWQDSK